MNAEVITVPILTDNYAFLIVREDLAICVDPGEALPILRTLNERDLRLEAILVTHEDIDHIDGIPTLVARESCPVFGPELKEIPHLSDPVEGGMILDLLDMAIQVIATPGHREHDISYYLPEVGSVFCGDTLFTGGCGRRRTASAEMYWNSIQTLNRLPGGTRVYSGHEYAMDNYWFASEMTSLHVFVERYDWAREHACTVPTTLIEERRSNVFLRAGDPAIVALCGMEGKLPWQVFDYLRSEKDHF